jgi:hypothetical protein
MGGVARARNLVFLMFAVVISGLGGGCSFVPTTEIKVFQESVTAANTAATPVLDELASVMRSEKRRTTSAAEQRYYWAGNGVIFVPSDASLFSDIGDPDQVAVFRRAHNVLERLSDVLVGLAAGKGAEADAGAIEGLASEMIELAALVPGANVSATATEAGLGVLKPALIQLSKELNRREARRVIEQVYDQKMVDEIIERLVRATPAMFNKLVQNAQLRAVPPTTADATKAYADRVLKIRSLLSNYVVLLRRVNDAWNEAVKAEKSRSSGDVAVLTVRIGELKAAAVATRKAYADMNADR